MSEFEPDATTQEIPAEELGTGALTERAVAGKTDLQRIREKHATGTKATRVKDIGVPGFEGDVAIRYKVLPWGRAREIEMAAASEPEAHDLREVNVMVDEMIAACESVLVRRTDGEMRPLENEAGGLLKLYDREVVEALGVTFDYQPESRDVVYALFGAPDEIVRDDVPRMISLHFDEYLAWLNRPARTARVGE